MASAVSQPMQIESAGGSVAPYNLRASDGFAAWLHEAGIALAVTTYQIGKLFLIGAPAPDLLIVAERTFELCLGLTADSQSLTLAFRNAFPQSYNVVPS